MTVSLEQLVGEYLDHELSPEEMAQVEKLLRNDIRAKQIHDEILSLRRGIRALPDIVLPDHFQKDLFEKIAIHSPKRNLAKVSNQRWWKKRLANPRIWIYPLAVVLVVLCLIALERSDSNRSPRVASTNVPEKSSDEIQKPARFRPPLAEGSNVLGTPKNEPLTAESTLEIVCTLSEEALKKKYIHRLLAENGIPSLTRTNGITSDVFYETEITPIQLTNLLGEMYADQNSVVGLAVPPTFSTIFDRSSSNSKSDIEPTTQLKVRFIVKNAQ